MSEEESCSHNAVYCECDYENAVKSQLAELRAENGRIREALEELVMAVRGSGRISHAPQAIYTPQIGVEWLKHIEQALGGKP